MNNPFLKLENRTDIQQIESFELINSKISSEYLINTDRNVADIDVIKG